MRRCGWTSTQSWNERRIQFLFCSQRNAYVSDGRRLRSSIKLHGERRIWRQIDQNCEQKKKKRKKKTLQARSVCRGSLVRWPSVALYLTNQATASDVVNIMSAKKCNVIRAACRVCEQSAILNHAACAVLAFFFFFSSSFISSYLECPTWKKDRLDVRCKQNVFFKFVHELIISSGYMKKVIVTRRGHDDVRRTENNRCRLRWQHSSYRDTVN